MVLDTSALLAILLGEPEAAALAQAIANDPRRLLSAVSELETAIVIAARKGPAGTAQFDLLRAWIEIETVSMNAEQVRLARALARYRAEPLLFKGNDFAETDIPAVAY
jgi:ribonuclease VapC